MTVPSRFTAGLNGFIHKGMYQQSSRASLPPLRPNRTHSRVDPASIESPPPGDLARLSTMVANYFWTTYSTLNGNYLAIVTVVLIVMLSFVIPDISQKIHRTHELKAMKKVLLKMSNEVGRAEVACLTVADEIRCLHCSMQDGVTETIRNQSNCTSGSIKTTQSEPVQAEKKMSIFRRFFSPKKNVSHKEVTIMSYLYTDSFDGGAKHLNNTTSFSEYAIAKDQ